MKRLFAALTALLFAGSTIGNDFYNHGTFPVQGSAATSAGMRAELDLIDAGFDKLPTLTANGLKIIAVNSGATALEAITTTGTGSGVRATTPTFTTSIIVPRIDGQAGTGGTLTLRSNSTDTTTGLVSIPMTTASTTTGTGALVVGGGLGLGGALFGTTASMSGQITSTLATGSAPFVVASTTQVANLNVATAGNLAGGLIGQIPYQTGAGATSFIAAGATTEILVGGGAAIPVWTTATGSGAPVRATSPALVTPTLGVATATSLGITGTAGTGFVDIIGQASNPSAPAAGTLRIHSSTANGFTRMEQDNEATTNLIYGRDSVIIAKNTSGGQITKGSAVYSTGSTGNVTNIAKAKADSGTTLPAIGIVLDTIDNNNFGQVMVYGVISSFDTSAFSTGDKVFVSAATAGALTATRPSGTTNAVQRMGSILVSGVGNGSMLVAPAHAVLNMETGTNAATWTGTNGVFGGTLQVTGDAALNGANLTTTATTVTAFGGATVALNIGGTGATSTVAIPGTLEATSSTAASLKTAGGLGVAKKAYFGDNINSGGTITGTAITATSTGQVISSTGASTSNRYGLLQNTGAGLYWGIEGSGGGQLITGTAAYAAAFQSSTELDISVNGGTSINAAVTSTGIKANGSYVPTTICQTAIPVGIPSSGTIGNNGALSAITALPTTFAHIYLYFPADAISAGSAAGFYYTIMSSTTAGTIYNNTYTSGVPTIPGSPTAFSTTGPGAYTQTTATTLSLASCTIPANAMGPNGSISIDPLWSISGSTNARTPGVYFDGTLAVGYPANATSANIAITQLATIFNRGVTNSQLGKHFSNGVNSSPVFPIYTSIDTTQAKAITLTGAIAVATDFIILEGYSLVVKYGP